MASVPPSGIRVPMLSGGPHAAAAAPLLAALGFRVEQASDRYGVASAIKMCRSVVVKGMEAIVIESFLAARRYGIENQVLATLAQTFPGIDWEKNGSYFFQRVIQHGRRRAEEMREAAVSVREVGLEPLMTSAIVARQAWVADLAQQRHVWRRRRETSPGAIWPTASRLTTKVALDADTGARSGALGTACCRSSIARRDGTRSMTAAYKSLAAPVASIRPRAAHRHALAFTRNEWARLAGLYGVHRLPAHLLGCGLFLYYSAHHPALVGLGFVAYMFGLRHAFDADHIAAVDDTVRFMLQKGKRPAGRRLLLFPGPLDGRARARGGDHLRGDGDQARAARVAKSGRHHRRRRVRNVPLGDRDTQLSSCCWTCSMVWRQAKTGKHSHAHLEELLSQRGFMNRLFGGRLQTLISHSWQMYPLGMLFGTRLRYGVRGWAAGDDGRRVGGRHCRSPRCSRCRSCSPPACRRWIRPMAC